jgi:hypothetical protein
MSVDIHDARHDRHARGVDDAIGRGRKSPLAGNAAAGELGGPGFPDRGDCISLDEDVERTARRITGAIDDVRVTNEQTSVALASRGRRRLRCQRRRDWHE